MVLSADAVEKAWLSLTLEHKMAASRLGFKNFYESLYNVSSYRQGLMDGSLSVIGVLTHIFIPLHHADLNNNPFEKAKIANKHRFYIGTLVGERSFLL